MRRAHVLSLSLALGLASVAVGWQGAVNQLLANGQVVSTNLKTVDGTLMVPVKDVASYLGGGLQIQNGTATIAGTGNTNALGTTPAGNPITGMTTGSVGSFTPNFTPPKAPEAREVTTKVGETVDTGGLSFQVVGVEEPKGSYRTQNDPRQRRISPRLKDERLVVVRMRVENRSDETRRPVLPSGLDIALFGEDGVGVPLTAIDVRPIGNPDLGPDLGSDFGSYQTLDAPILAPKGAFEFAMVFSLPKDRTPNRLTVALPAVSADTGGTNVTVALR